MIAIGSDHGGLELKKHVNEWLQDWGYQIKDFGVLENQSVDYPDYALPVAQSVTGGEAELGILICGTGIGMAIAANKVCGARAASVRDVYSARMLREHNNGNILCLGARVTGIELAREIVKAFLQAEFLGGRHIRRVEKINSIERLTKH